MPHIQDQQSNQRAAKRLSEPCNIYRRAGYNGVFEPHLGNNVAGIPMGSMITMKVCRPSGKSHSTLFPNFHEEVMYESVDNSRNDCINENKELDNQEQHKFTLRQEIRLLRHKIHRLVPRANTIVHACEELMQVNSKGGREGGQISTVFDKSD